MSGQDPAKTRNQALATPAGTAAVLLAGARAAGALRVTLRGTPYFGWAVTDIITWG